VPDGDPDSDDQSGQDDDQQDGQDLECAFHVQWKAG
jgi:hypothetical protein